MRLAGALVLLFLPVFAGCAGQTTTNPNLLAPKVVIGAPPDGKPEVFVHAAFGDYAYDAITLRFDNGTQVTHNFTYSVDEDVPARDFFLNVTARTGESAYQYAAFVRFTGKDHIDLSALTATGWSEPRGCSLPCERLLSREGSS